MLIKFIKYFVAFTTFIMGCMGVFYNREVISEVTGFKYNENGYKELKIEYIASLTIPKISFSRVLYELNDKRNDLEENIIFVSGSSMPDEEKGNVIIAGHNGNSNISYFKDLNKLDLKDTFTIKYNNIEYNYKIVKKYLVKKNGTVEINRDIRFSTVTLITCYGKDKQLVIIANLEQKKII
jgi:LPXTG-site transpeptidase (sortase) family protein